MGLALDGQSGDEIATEEQLPKRTVNSLVEKTSTRDTVQNKPRPGQPLKYNSREERQLVKYAQIHPKWTYHELKRETGLTLHQTTLRRILHKHGLITWRAKKRPHLTQGHATQRLQFARSHINADWSNCLFSDECSVEKGKGKKTVWVFGYPSENWDSDKIETYNKGKGLAMMI